MNPIKIDNNALELTKHENRVNSNWSETKLEKKRIIHNIIMLTKQISMKTNKKQNDNIAYTIYLMTQITIVMSMQHM